MDSSIEYKRAKLQEELDRIPEGGTCTLYHSENPGPLVIKRAMNVECTNVTIYSSIGPVLKILSSGVVLKNLKVEVTSDVLSGTDAGCAIQVMQGATVKFDHIVVKGSILGMKGEEGIWRYPNTLYLGCLAFGAEHVFTLHLGVPVSCKLKSGIQGVDIQPASLEPGFHKIKLSVENGISRDTVINGPLSIITEHFIRHICLNGHVRESKHAPLNIVFGRGQVIWEPSDWAILTAPPPKETQEESRVQTGPISGPDSTEPDSTAPTETLPDDLVLKKIPSPRIIDPSSGETTKTVGVPTDEFISHISKKNSPSVDTTPTTSEKEKSGLPEIFKPIPRTSNESNNETIWATPKSTPIKSPPITDSIFLNSKTPKMTSPSSDTITDEDQLDKDENQILPVEELSKPSPKSDVVPNSLKSRKRIVKPDAIGSIFNSWKNKNNSDG